jgi:hypothetical protein
VLADGCLGDDELPGDRAVGVAFGDEGEDLMFAGGQRGQRVAAAPHQLAYHLGVDGGAAAGHAAQRSDEVLALTAVTGLGPLLRMAAAADSPRIAPWLAGALFIPSLALMLGTASRTHRTFQAIYVILWYGAANQVAAADYMGTVLADGRPAGPPHC